MEYSFFFDYCYCVINELMVDGIWKVVVESVNVIILKKFFVFNFLIKF